jgi:hypothetical protein
MIFFGFSRVSSKNVAYKYKASPSILGKIYYS